MKLINIGFGSMIVNSRVLSILEPESAPIKRLVQEARERGMLIDASYGRKTKSVIALASFILTLTKSPTFWPWLSKSTTLF